MPEEPDLNRGNDTKLLTPLLVMALIIAVGFLISAYAGHGLSASG